MRDLLHNISVVSAIDPHTFVSDTAAAGNIIDTKGYDSALIVLTTGTLAAASATFAVAFYHGDDPTLSDAVLVPSWQVTGTLPASFTQAADSVVYKWGYAGGKRYINVSVTPTGVSAGAAYVASVESPYAASSYTASETGAVSAVVVFGRPHSLPTA